MTSLSSKAEVQTITYHTLTSHSTDTAILPQLLALSNGIFSEALESSSGSEGDVVPHSSRPSTQLAKWQSNLSIPGSVIAYGAVSNKRQEEEPMAFLFAVPRTHPEISVRTFHIWLAGVEPKLRGTGVWKGLMDRLLDRVRLQGVDENDLSGRAEERSEKTILSICTYPKRFERMYALLRKNGWETVAWREEGQKVLMKLEV